MLSHKSSTKETKHFKDNAEMLAAWQDGSLKGDDNVKVG